MDLVTLWAGPGCGKTECLVRVAKELIQRGEADRSQLAYVAFQRDAAFGAAKRVGISGEDYRSLWWRTLHSTCYRLLRISGDKVVTPVRMRDFSKKIGLSVDNALAVEGDEMADLAEVVLAIQKDRSSEDEGAKPSRIIALYQLSRLKCRKVDELKSVRKEPHPGVFAQMEADLDISEYASLVAAYESWKSIDGLLDFVDMLERILTSSVQLPDWKYAFVDEAQDLSPLQWAVVEKLFFEVPRMTFLAGDDDQAIMSFQGSSASDFLSYRERSTVIHLRQTHRFGEQIVKVGRAITDRLSIRENKEILSDPSKTNHVQKIYDFDPAVYEGKKFLLHRHKRGCSVLARNMIHKGQPFWNERGINPLARSSEIAGYLATSKVIRGESVTGTELGALLRVVPSFRTRENGKVRLVKHGVKKKVSDRDPRFPYTRTVLEGFFTPDFWNSVLSKDWSITEIEFPEYYERLEKKGWNLLGEAEPDIIITSIHGSKGRERKNTFLWDEVLPKCLRSEDEHRVAYVGATRTQGALYIVSERLIPEWNMARYPYPVG
ncbi:MAG: hypothetical protein EHM36_00075 [Deltaproteobacteria bacterium]|nr:MAG: hypothetical protein EHM36_00075 [Deltaproteobacteria bacterium]